MFSCVVVCRKKKSDLENNPRAHFSTAHLVLVRTEVDERFRIFDPCASLVTSPLVGYGYKIRDSDPKFSLDINSDFSNLTFIILNNYGYIATQHSSQKDRF